MYTSTCLASLLVTLTDFAEGAPVHALGAASHQREADGGADDCVRARDGQTKEGRQQVPHSRTAWGQTGQHKV